MIRMWKSFRVNLMYWRFRHITRNRLRMQSWYRRRQPVRPRVVRDRGQAAYVYRRSPRRSWIILIGLVVVLTALQVTGNHLGWSGSLTWALSSLIIVLAIYLALRDGALTG